MERRGGATDGDGDVMNKKELRAILRERSAGLPEEYIESAGSAIAANVESSRLYEDADRIFIYVSMPREPGTDGIIEDALCKGKKVYVPRCIKGPEHLMEGVRITSLDDLEAGSYGIREPRRCEGGTGDGASGEICRPEDLELAIVPCVSAWTDGRRLGHGAGYYDRFLEHCSCPKLILCFERMLDERIEMDEHDIYMDVVVTEGGMHYTECPPEAGSNSCEVLESSGSYTHISKKTEPLKLPAGFRSTEDIITIQSRNRKEGM